MRLSLSFIFLLPALWLAGCSTDDMVPKAPVGNEAKLSRPPESVMPRQPVVTTSRVETAALDRRGPQNSLQAQAEALAETGRNPVASGPLETASVQQPEETETLNRTEAEPAREAEPAVQTVSVAAPSAGTIRFLPIIGAPVKAVTPLSRQLGAEARASGLTIKSSSDPNAEHILKGYLSAFNDGQKTSVVYVWDVLDASGQRLNRIQGQEDVPGAATDAWASVPDETMRAIATQSISRYMAWKSGT